MFGKLMDSKLVVMSTILAVGCATERADEPQAPSSTDELIGWSTPCQPLSDLSDVSEIRIERLTADDGNVRLRVGILEPEGLPVGDVLFLHGFSDRFDNHLPLFETWREAGLRVVSFDYPSHGETCGFGIDRYKMEGLAKLAAEVAHRTQPTTSRPFLLAGWSTGGLLAVRMLQAPGMAPLPRAVDGAILFAPGIDVRLFVGDHQFVTLETLTRNPDPPHFGEITPRSPLFTPLFAADLVWNSAIARREPLPDGVPLLVVTGGDDDDVYVNSNGVRAWVKDRRERGHPLFGLSCDGARHELDNEPAPVGDHVRDSAGAFASWAVRGAYGEPSLPTSDGCFRY